MGGSIFIFVDFQLRRDVLFLHKDGFADVHHLVKLFFILCDDYLQISSLPQQKGFIYGPYAVVQLVQKVEPVNRFFKFHID